MLACLKLRSLYKKSLSFFRKEKWWSKILNVDSVLLKYGAIVLDQTLRRSNPVEEIATGRFHPFSEIVTAIIINVARWKACHLIGINLREYGGIETRFHIISIPRAEYA